jgi:hypothetical protein
MATNIIGQKILVVENIHSLKNFKYYQGNDIYIQVEGKDGRLADMIVDITDTSVIFEVLGEVKMNDIKAIYRENWLIQTIRGLSLLGGAGYLGIDSFNRMINHEYPVVQTETLVISGCMIAISFALTPLKYRKISIAEKWKLKPIDPMAY